MHTSLTKVAALALTTVAFSVPAFAQNNNTASPPATMASPSVTTKTMPPANATMPSTMTTPRAQNDMNKNSMTDSANMTTTGARRVSKLIGMDVVNDKDETIGKVDDILIGPNDKATTAVISVGGFLGVGAKLVTLPYDQLQRAPNDRHSLTVPNASKAQLKSMPEYKYGQGA